MNYKTLYAPSKDQKKEKVKKLIEVLDSSPFVPICVDVLQNVVRNQLEKRKRKMRISGYAYTSREKEVAQERQNRFEEIKDQGKILIESSDRNIAQVVYKGKLLDESLTPLDVALLCDNGSVCFGGICNVNTDGTFLCTIYTD